MSAQNDRPKGCEGCRNGQEWPTELCIAFQPIGDIIDGRVFAYEALVRGPNGETASSVMAQVSKGNLYSFDQACRVAAIRQSVSAGIVDTGAKLSINFMPNAVYSPMACIQLTLITAREVGLPIDRLMFEFTENEKLDSDHIRSIIEAYNSLGFTTAIDDFGAGYAGLNLLATMPTDFIKLDMELIRGIDTSVPRRQIVGAMVRLADEMDFKIIAEGVETPGEYATLRDLGVRYLQGYLFARPEIGRLPEFQLEANCRAAA